MRTIWALLLLVLARNVLSQLKLHAAADAAAVKQALQAGWISAQGSSVPATQLLQLIDELFLNSSVVGPPKGRLLVRGRESLDVP